MSQQMLETLVDEVLTQDELRQFLLDHPPGDLDQSIWPAAVAEAAGKGALKGLVFRRGFKTDVVTETDWRRYVEYSIKNGHPEDVTVGPASERAYLGILKAYRFLNERAERQGRHLDVIDFISAISPVVRRMRESAVDGVILLGIPTFMRSIPFRNIGQPTLAQQILAAGLLTEVNESTFASWVSGKVRNPTYREMRKNAASIAAQARGGRDVADNLYVLQVVFRYAFILENYAAILNPLGGRESFASEERPARFTLRLVKDVSEYELGRSASRGIETNDDMIVKVKSGYYDRLIENVRDYLLAIKRLPFKAQITLSDGRAISIDDYLEKIREMESRNVFDSTSLRGQTSLLSVDQIDVIRRNYERLSEFAQEVYFYMRVRGEVEVKGGRVGFDAAPRVEGHKYDSSRLGLVVLFLDDVEQAAQKGRWSDARKGALLTMRLIAGQLIFKQEMAREDALVPERLAAAAGEYWPLHETLFDNAVADFIELEHGAKAARLTDRIGDVTRRMDAGRVTAAGPVLPWWAPRWTEQFKIFAEGRGVEAGDIEKTGRALAEYFSQVKGFYATFWENTLRGKLEAQFGKRAKGKTDEIFALVKEFLPTVGTRVDDVRAAAVSGRMTIEDIARLALNQYAAFFNIGDALQEQLPIDEGLLRDVSNLLCVEHNELEATLVFDEAKRLLIGFNVGKRGFPLAVVTGEEAVPVIGHVLDRLQAFAREKGASLKDAKRAYFDALQGILNVGAGLSPRLSREGTEPLPYADDPKIAEFLSTEAALVDRWREIIGHDRYGFVRFVRDKYKAPYFTDEGLSKFAEAFGLSILAIPEGADIKGLSLEAVHRAYAPYADITEKMARFHRILLGRYLKFLGDEFSTTVELVAAELDSAADGDISKVSTPELLLTEALKSLGVEEKEFDKIEKYNALIEEIFGIASRSKGMAAVAQEVFDKKVAPKIEEARKKAERLSEELEAEEGKITAFAGEAGRLSLEEYVTDPSSLTDEAACNKVIAAIERGLALIAGFESKKPAAVAAADTAERKAQELRGLYYVGAGLSPRPDIPREGVFREMVKDAASQVSTLKSSLEADRTSVIKRRDDIKMERDRREAEAAAVVLDGEIDEAIAKFDALSARLEGDFVQPVATAAAEAEAFVIDPSSYETFLAGARAINSISKDRLPGLHDKLLQINSDGALIGEGSILARASALTARLGDATRSGIEAKVAELEDRMRRLKVPQETQDALARIRTQTEEKIEEAEARLPIMPMAENLWVQPANLPDGEMIIVEGREVRFNTDRPRQDYRGFISERLNEIISCRVVSTADGSAIVAPNVANAIIRWQHGDRKSVLNFDDIGGWKLNSGFGMRVIAPTEHPDMARIVKALSLIAGENSYEGYLVAQLLGKRQDTRALAIYLFATIASKPEVANAKEARSLVRRWAVAARDVIRGVLGKKANDIFIEGPAAVAGAGMGAPGRPPQALTDREPSEYVKWWETEFGASYTEEEWTRHRATAALDFETALWGEIRIKLKDAEKDSPETIIILQRKVEPVSFHEFMEGRRETVLAYNQIERSVEEVDLRRPLPTGHEYYIDVSADELRNRIQYVPPKADDPATLERIEIARSIHRDPILRPLAWVLSRVEAYDNENGTAVSEFLWREPMEREENLLEKQDAILAVYKRLFIDAFAEAPEVVAVPRDEAIKWAKRAVLKELVGAKYGSGPELDREVGRQMALVRQNEDASNVYRMFMILSETVFNPELNSKVEETEGYKQWRTFLTTMAARSRDWKKVAAEMKAFYLLHRAEVLKHKPKLRQIALAKLSPSELNIPWDRELNERFPEVGWVSFGAIADGMNAKSTVSGGAFRHSLYLAGAAFPRLLQMLTLIFVADKTGRLPQEYRTRFQEIWSAYDLGITEATTDELEDGTRADLIELYETARPAVIEMLKDIEDPAKRAAMQHQVGFDLGKLMLTSRVPASWEGRSKLEKLRAAVPEYFSLRQDILAGIAKVNAKGVQIPELEAVHRFSRDFPELSPIEAFFDTIVTGGGRGEGEPIKVARRYSRAVMMGGPIDREAFLNEFATASLDPIYVAALRRALDARLVHRGGLLDLEGAFFEGLERFRIETVVSIVTNNGGKPGQTIREILLNEGRANEAVPKPKAPSVREPSERVRLWEAKFGATYPSKDQASYMEEARFESDTALWGTVFITIKDKESGGEFIVVIKVDPKTYGEFMDGKRGTVIIYGDQGHKVKEFDLKKPLPDGHKFDVTFTLEELKDQIEYVTPAADTPRRMSNIEAMRRIHGDPALRPLSWIFHRVETGGLDLGTKVSIGDYFRMQYLDGGVDLLEAQDKMLETVVALSDGTLKALPEVDTVPKALKTWPSKVARLKAAVPEYFMVRPEVVKILAGISGEAGRPMSVLMKRFPEVASVWPLIAFLPMPVEEQKMFNRKAQSTLGGGERGENEDSEGSISWFIDHVSQPVLVSMVRQFLDSKIERDEETGHFMIGTPEFRQMNLRPEARETIDAALNGVGARPGQRLRDVLLDEGKAGEAKPGISDDISFWEARHGAEYTEAKHGENHGRSENGLNLSLWGTMNIENQDGRVTDSFVVPQHWEDFQKGARDDIVMFVPGKGPTPVDLRTIINRNGIRSIGYNKPLAEDPKQLNRMKFARRVFGDPALRPLGWLISHGFEGSSDTDLREAIMRRFIDRAGTTPLADIQRGALSAYRQYKESGRLPEAVPAAGGTDELPTTWEGIPPIDRLRAAVPELFLLRKDIVDDARSASAEAVKMGGEAERVARLGNDFYELSSAVIFKGIVVEKGREAEGSSNVAQRYADAVMSGKSVDREAVINEFVEASLDPIYVTALRRTLEARLVRKGGRFDVEGPAFSGVDRGRVEMIAKFLRELGGQPGQTIGEILMGKVDPWGDAGKLPSPSRGEGQGEGGSALAEYPELDEIDLATLNSFVDRVYASFSEGMHEEIGLSHSQIADVGVARIIAGIKTLIQENPNARRHLAMIMLLDRVEDEAVERHVTSVFANTGGRRNLMDELMLLSGDKDTGKRQKKALSVLVKATGESTKLASPAVIEKTIGFYRKHNKNKGGQ